MMVCLKSTLFSSIRRCRQLLLWPRPSDETQENCHDSQPHQPLQALLSSACLCKTYALTLTSLFILPKSPLLPLLTIFSFFRNPSSLPRKTSLCSTLLITLSTWRKSAARTWPEFSRSRTPVRLSFFGHS